MNININHSELISAVLGGFVGYKGKVVIQGWISSVRKFVSGIITPK